MNFATQPLLLSAITAWLLAGGGAVLCADELVLKNGQEYTGAVLRTDGKTVTLAITIGQGRAEVPYPLAQIQHIRFSNDPALEALLLSTDPRQLPRVAGVWVKRRPLLSLEGSDSGAWALRCARMQLAQKTRKAATEAVALCRLVEAEDWDAGRRSEATRLRLAALAASGKIEEAIREAEGMREIAGEDEATLAESRVHARFLLAERAWVRLLDLEKKWPKWRLMPEKCREHAQWRNEALDGFLFPVVFHAGLTSRCAEGLLRVAEIEAHGGHADRSLAALEEVLVHFPDPGHLDRAEQLKKQLEKKNPPPTGKKS